MRPYITAAAASTLAVLASSALAQATTTPEYVEASKFRPFRIVWAGHP